MSEDSVSTDQVSVFNKIVGIFTSPREAFVSINQNPNWLTPYIIGLIFFFIFQYTTMDIQMEYQIANIEAKDVPAEQLETMKNYLQGPIKYVGFIIGPIAILLLWLSFASCFLLFGKWMIGGHIKFKKAFSFVAWSSLVGNLSLILLTFLILSKGTMHGIAMDLSLLLPTPAIGTEPGLLYLFLSKFDIFIIWQNILWIIGLSVTYNTTTQKAAMPILTLWGLWIVISVTFTSLLGGLF